MKETRKGLTKTTLRYKDGKIDDANARVATVVDCLEAILDVAAGLGREDKQEIKNIFNREHRTNQQAFVREVLMVISRSARREREARLPRPPQRGRSSVRRGRSGRAGGGPHRPTTGMRQSDMKRLLPILEKKLDRRCPCPCGCDCLAHHVSVTIGREHRTFRIDVCGHCRDEEHKP